MAKALVWLCGDWTGREWGAALQWLESRADCRRVELDDLKKAGAPPGAVVVAQTRPGDVLADYFEQLPAAAGDVPVFLLAGPWCEGELRSGWPPEEVTRIEWRRWRWGLEVDVAPLLDVSARERPRYALAPDSLLIARNLAAVKKVKPAFGSATICTDRRTLFESLVDALGQLGIRAAGPATQSAGLLARGQLVLYDGWLHVERHQATSGPDEKRRELLLLDWPRPTDAERAASAGIHEILALPFLFSDLARAVA